MKYKLTTDRHPFEKGTEFKLDDSIDGIQFSTAFDEVPRIGNAYLDKYPNDFQPIEQFKEGQYWAWNNSIYRVEENNSSCDTDWHMKAIDGSKGVFVDDKILIDEARKLSTHEIEQALIKEAKRRGFEIGKRVRTPGGFEHEIRGNTNIDYYPNSEKLYFEGPLVYHEGQWAELLDQTPHIEINGYEVEIRKDIENVNVGCKDISYHIFIDLAIWSEEFDLSIVRKGEDITEQITKIAEYYE